jgi:pimeloyl-ACP methyl ester carboxylesterase
MKCHVQGSNSGVEKEMKTPYSKSLSTAVMAFIIALLIGQAGSAQVQNSPSESSEGLWSGAPKIGNQAVPPIVFRIIKNLDGRFNAYLESPDGIRRIRASRVTSTNEIVRVDVDEIGGVFEGRPSDDRLSMDGKWTQAGRSFPLVIKRTNEQPRPNRPQEPKKPYPYDVEEIVCENKEAGVKLAGTLTLPHTKGPFPAVRIIGGSGSLNRDDECFGHRTFLVLADYLTRRGLAVLRLDKRGVWKSGGRYENATTEDFASDALASVEYLKSRNQVDPKRIGLIGHSEGAMIAPMLAAKSPDIAFIVMIAGPGVPLDETMTIQNCLYAEAGGADRNKVEFLRDWYKRFYAVAINEKEDTAAAEKIRKMYADLNESQKQMLGWSEEKLDREIGEVLSPWHRYLLAFDPKVFLTKVKCPVLAVIGQKDLQVSSAENLAGIDEALKAGGNRKYIVKELPGLNHLLQTAETGAESEYAQIEETIAPLALKTIGDWIIKQTSGAVTEK